MFLWCCPWRKRLKQQDPLQQPLVQSAGNGKSLNVLQEATLTPETLPKKRTQQAEKTQKIFNEDTKSEPQQQQKIKNQMKLEQRLNKTESKPKVDDEGVAPAFSKAEIPRPFSPRQHHKFIGSSKKSHLWKEALKSDLIYLSPSSPDFVYMSYRLLKNQETKDYLNGLDYFLSKSPEKVHFLVGRLSVLTSKLATISKHQHNTVNLIISNKARNGAVDQNLGHCESVLVQDLRGLRWTGIGSIVILTDTLHNYAEVKDYFNSIVKNISWDDFRRFTFIFPAFMALEQISQLLFPCIKQTMLNLTLEKASLDLAFDMELIEGSNLESCIIIKNRSDEVKQANSVYDHLKTSIVFFGKELSELTQRFYIDFYIQTREKSLKEYFDLKQFYRRNPTQFRLKVKQMKDLQPKLFTDLENSIPLKDYQCEDCGYYYVIQNKVREDIGKIYNIVELQKKEVDTPVKKQWDDDATVDDFKTVKTSKLDMVAKEELDQIDLDMGLCDDDDEECIYRAASQDLNDIQMRVEENVLYEKAQMEQAFKLEQMQRVGNRKEMARNRCDRNHRYGRF